TCLFEAAADRASVQALLQNLYYANQLFSLSLFTNGQIHPMDRMVQLSLTDPTNHHATLSQLVALPDLLELEWRPLGVGLDFGGEADLALYAEFIYSDNKRLNDVLFAVSPFAPTHNCQGALQITHSADGMAHVVANSVGHQADQCTITYRAGHETAEASVWVGSDCVVVLLTVLSYYLNISGEPNSLAKDAISPAAPMISTNTAIISLSS